ncbi:MAG: fibronectin type III domain-containing protein [Terriglobales bacterium]
MTKKLFSVILFTVVALCCAGLAFGQSQVQITNQPVVQSTSGDTAFIMWSTNVPASAVVKYGTDPNRLDQTAEAPWGGTNHGVHLKGLQSGKTYYFTATSGQASGSGTSTSSQVSQFVAGSTNQQAPWAAASQFENSTVPQVQITGADSATIMWNTNQASGSIVKYGTDPNNLSQTAQAPGPGSTNHSVTLTGLQPGKTYYYYVTSNDASGHSSSSQIGQFVAGQGH